MKRLLLFFSIFFAASVAFAADKIAPNPEKIAAVQSGTCDEALASWWGFDPEDSTDSLQKAFDSGVARLKIDKQPTPWIVRPLYLKSGQEITLENGAEIQAKRGEFRGGGDSLLTLDDVADVVLRGEGDGATLRMFKEDYLQPPYELAEWRHAIEICHSKNVRIENLSILNSGGDGIYVGATPSGPCEKIELRDLISDGNNRQGISVISVRGLRVVDCVFKNTRGTNPSAGVDFEPNSPENYLENVLFERCVFESNAADGISFYLVQLDEKSPPIDVRFENCETRRNGKAGFLLTTPTGRPNLRGKIVVENSTFSGDFDGIRFENKQNGANFVEFRNVKVVDAASNSSDADRSPITILSGVRDSAPSGGILFDGLEVVDSLDRDAIFYRDSSRAGVGVENIRGKIVVRRTLDGPVVRTLELDDAFWNARFPDINPEKIPEIATEQNEFVPFSGANNSGANGEKKSDETSVAPGLRARNQGDFRLYAEKGDKIHFTLQEFPYAMIAKDPVELEWTTPSGRKTKLEPLEFLEKRTFELDADETGVYRLYFDVNPHNLLFSDCDVPFVFWAEPYAMAIEYAQTFYFFVPSGTKNFGLKFDDGNYVARVVDPNGNVRFDGNRLPPIYFPSGEISSGIWEIRFAPVDGKPMGTVCFNLLGIPSCVATEKSAVFVPKSEVAAKK